MALKLFKLTREEGVEYDTYDAAVVAAPDEDTARNMDPHSGEPMHWDRFNDYWASSPDKVVIEVVGDAAEGVKQGVVLASYKG